MWLPKLCARLRRHCVHYRLPLVVHPEEQIEGVEGGDPEEVSIRGPLVLAMGVFLVHLYILATGVSMIPGALSGEEFLVFSYLSRLLPSVGHRMRLADEL